MLVSICQQPFRRVFGLNEQRELSGDSFFDFGRRGRSKTS